MFQEGCFIEKSVVYCLHLHKGSDTMETIRTDALVAQQLGVDLNTAAALIMEGRIWIGNVPAEKPGSPLPADTVITCREKAKKYAKLLHGQALIAAGFMPDDPTGFCGLLSELIK